MNIIALLSLVPAIIVSAYGSLFLKQGSKDISLNPKLILKNKKFLLGITLYCSSVLFYINALRYESLSILYPLGSFVYVLIAILSVKHLGEKMTFGKWIGIIFIIIGSILIVS